MKMIRFETLQDGDQQISIRSQFNGKITKNTALVNSSTSYFEVRFELVSFFHISFDVCFNRLWPLTPCRISTALTTDVLHAWTDYRRTNLKKNGHDIDGTTSRKLLAKTPTLKTRKQKEREKKAFRNLACNQNLRLFGKGDGCEAEGSLDCKQSRSTNTHTHAHRCWEAEAVTCLTRRTRESEEQRRERFLRERPSAESMAMPIAF